MSNQHTWREELVVDLEGGNADNHEIDAAVLGSSLQSLSAFVTKASSIVYGKDCKVNVKVKGAFREGSFDYTVIMDFFGGIAPVACEMSKAILGYIDLLKFLKGEKPQKIEPVEPQDPEQSNMDNSVTVTNSNGDAKVYSPTVVAMNNHGSINISFGGALAPLGKGADTMIFKSTIASSEDPSDVSKGTASITKEEKMNMLNLSPEIISCEETQRTLEVLTPHMDGKPTGWRFYDIEDATEYYANIEDSEFLENVRNHKLIFHHGSKISATVRITKKLVTERKRTERVLTNITVLPDEEAD